MRLLLLFFLCLASVAQAKDFTMRFAQEEWSEIGNPQEFTADMVVHRDGTKVFGRIEALPPIQYAFGAVSFRVDEVAAVAFHSKEEKVEYVTRSGQKFIGSLKRRPWPFQKQVIKEVKLGPFMRDQVSYQPGTIDPDEVNFILFKQRGDPVSFIGDRYHKLVLRGGDQFPVIVATTEINLSDGWKDFTIRPKRISDVLFNGGLQGYLKGEGFDQKLPFSFVRDHFLDVRLAKNGEVLRIPWENIERVVANMGEFVVTTPYFFSKWRPDDMVFIPPGRFMVGHERRPHSSQDLLPTLFARKGLNQEELDKAVYRGPLVPTSEAPSVLIELPAYYMDKYEVTNAEYAQFVQETGYPAPTHWRGGRIPEGLEDHPVVNVSFVDAEEFAAWAGKRIPSELEWERAAKGGSGLQRPPGINVSYSNIGSDGTKPVGSYLKKRNQPGLQVDDWVSKDLADMIGNVAEWTASPFTTDGYSSLGRMNKSMGIDLTRRTRFRVVRGGSYVSSAETATTTFRAPLFEEDYNPHTGFRCVRDYGLN